VNAEILLSLLVSLHAIEDAYAGRTPAQVAADARSDLMRRLARMRVDREGYGIRPLAVAVEALDGTPELVEALEAVRTRGGDYRYQAPSMVYFKGQLRPVASLAALKDAGYFWSPKSPPPISVDVEASAVPEVLCSCGAEAETLSRSGEEPLCGACAADDAPACSCGAQAETTRRESGEPACASCVTEEHERRPESET
jgi:hypothetical protein